MEARDLRRILVVDDEPVILELYRLVLAGPSCSVSPAFNGREAIAVCREALLCGAPFHLAVIDLKLSGDMDGAATLQRLLGLDPRLKAVASSGWIDDTHQGSCRNLGFAAILPKPFSPGQLLAVVRSLLPGSA